MKSEETERIPQSYSLISKYISWHMWEHINNHNHDKIFKRSPEPGTFKITLSHKCLELRSIPGWLSQYWMSSCMKQSFDNQKSSIARILANIIVCIHTQLHILFSPSPRSRTEWGLAHTRLNKMPEICTG